MIPVIDNVFDGLMKEIYILWYVKTFYSLPYKMFS